MFRLVLQCLEMFWECLGLFNSVKNYFTNVKNCSGDVIAILVVFRTV